MMIILFDCLTTFSRRSTGRRGEFLRVNPGQTPIHPRYLAGAILYGIMKRIRSSVPSRSHPDSD